jgi:hypothetical protein
MLSAEHGTNHLTLYSFSHFEDYDRRKTMMMMMMMMIVTADKPCQFSLAIG